MPTHAIFVETSSVVGVVVAVSANAGDTMSAAIPIEAAPVRICCFVICMMSEVK